MGGTRIISHVERTARLKELVGAYLRSVPPAAGQAEARAIIDQEFWRTIGATAENLVLSDLPKDIDIKRDDRLLLSFGLVELDLMKPSVDAALAAMAKPAAREFTINYLHDVILGAYRDALRLETLARLRQKLTAIEKEVDEWPDAHLEFVKNRDRMVAEALPNSQQEENALRQYSELDERMEKFRFMERQNQNEGWRNAEDRKEWLTLKQYIEQRTQGVAKLLEPLTRQVRSVKDEISKLEVAAVQALRDARDHPEQTQLQKQAAGIQKGADVLRTQHAQVLAADRLHLAAEAVNESVNRLLDLRNERRLVESQILDEENTVHQITVGEVKGNLLNEVGNVRSMLRLAAKYGRVDECAVPVGHDGIVIERDAVLAALHEIEGMDPQLFANTGVKRFGRPSVVLAPGVGDGVYDTDRNRLVIPQRTLKTALDTVAHAVVLYRLDMDAAYDDRRLFRGYQEQIKDNTAIRSNLKLRQGLLRDYLIWVTQEARGNAVLPPDVREWFEQHIAPAKHHPMLPREYNGLSQRQIHQKLEETDRGQATADREYRVALLNWLLEPADETNLRDLVLPRIENALKLAPDDLAILYSAGALFKQARQNSRAADLFSRYGHEAAQGWRTKKAAELEAQCRG